MDDVIHFIGATEFVGGLKLAHRSGDRRLAGAIAKLSVTHKKDSRELTMFMTVAREELDEAEMELLLESGAERAEVDSTAAFRNAACCGHGAIVGALAAAGTDVGVADKEGKMALHHAARYGHGITVGVLLVARADVEAADLFGLTALHDATRSGHGSVVGQLVAAAAVLGAVDKFGATALSYAARNGPRLHPLGGTDGTHRAREEAEYLECVTCYEQRAPSGGPIYNRVWRRAGEPWRSRAARIPAFDPFAGVVAATARPPPSGGGMTHTGDWTRRADTQKGAPRGGHSRRPPHMAALGAETSWQPPATG